MKRAVFFLFQPFIAVFFGDLKEVPVPTVKPFFFLECGADIFDDTCSFGNGLLRKQAAPRTGTLNRNAVAREPQCLLYPCCCFHLAHPRFRAFCWLLDGLSQ